MWKKVRESYKASAETLNFSLCCHSFSCPTKPSLFLICNQNLMETIKVVYCLCDFSVKIGKILFSLFFTWMWNQKLHPLFFPFDLWPARETCKENKDKYTFASKRRRFNMHMYVGHAMYDSSSFYACLSWTYKKNTSLMLRSVWSS